MGQCKVFSKGELAKDESRLTTAQCIHVGMGQYAVSKDIPLMTWGALPCMNVVVHNRDRSRGCLAHISHCTLDQKDLYRTATESIDLMLREIGSQGKTDIFLFAGMAFVYESAFTMRNPQTVDYTDRLFEHLNGEPLSQPRADDWETIPEPDRVVYDYCAREYGEVAYFPKEDRIYVLDDAELRTLQSRMVEGKAKQFTNQYFRI